ncbi:lipoprotein signal peptidase [Thermobacillus composti KWC4]|uniref:Lipoprotein signal peptidase n=1 Tax=Thermobacillus composti (strain DSM 18247 / JCM 13945 / KWC4) TaxID=717605 RepID=L0EF40_THECK|nr:lipoprotein signal peptidase [Thermobacillus composti KWC4]
MKHLRYYAVAAVVFLLDQLTKQIIDANVALYEQISVIGQFFLITHVLNDGAAFSMLPGAQTLFILITIVVVIGIVWYIERNWRTGRPLLLTAFGLVLGGALGNFIDRLLYGHVIDFLQFNFGSYTFPIFNVADMGIVIGVGLILLDAVLDIRRERDKAAGSLEGDENGKTHDITSGTEADEPAR